MASFVTNRGLHLIAESIWRASNPVTTSFKCALLASTTTPTVDTNLMSDVTEISAGFGYTSGGITLEQSAVGNDVSTENDTDDRQESQFKDLVFTASGGNIGPARYAVITDDNATVANRQILIVIDLVSDRTVSDGQSLTIQNTEIRMAMA